MTRANRDQRKAFDTPNHARKKWKHQHDKNWPYCVEGHIFRVMMLVEYMNINLYHAGLFVGYSISQMFPRIKQHQMLYRCNILDTDTVRRKYRHFDEIFIIGCICSCQNVLPVTEISSTWRHFYFNVCFHDGSLSSVANYPLAINTHRVACWLLFTWSIHAIGQLTDMMRWCERP